MAFTKDSTDVTQAIVDKLEATTEETGLVDVYYGDPPLKPNLKSAAVESFPKDRTLREGTTRQFHLYLRTGITIYFGEVQSSEINKKESELLAERVEDVLHEDKTLGGLVIFGFVTAIDPGVARVRNVMLRATRMTWVGRTREVF